MALLNKKQMNFAYGMGAAVVIIGALFKITHLEFGWVTGNLMLTIGLVVEAGIFALSAFEPVDDEYKWENVYPQLLDEKALPVKANKVENTSEAQGMLSQKLDAMLKEAKIDGELMSSLGNSIKNFESAAKGISPTVDAIASTKKYSEELTLAAAQMESLNSLYKVQLQSAARNAQVNDEVVENNIKLKEQMQSLTSNLSSLNNVYGGMLTAMNNKG
ncbi:gliding motility protein GldL [Flavobacterium sp.]|uniref:type IX secretion system motor protein PorL/GldL n=1 Tax=Flavobacterium sp. TaxID=239 RepID=UPI00286BB3D7|nr:gliding motility protein GldL [Flavobacterium sp.]